MHSLPPEILNLAMRLVAHEAAFESSEGTSGATARACERLKTPLSKLVGVVGFRSLLTRAVALARMEHADIEPVQVRADGSLESIGTAVADGQAGRGEANPAIVAHLLGLLVEFIGEPLTLRLVRDAWPHIPSEHLTWQAGDHP